MENKSLGVFIIVRSKKDERKRREALAILLERTYTVATATDTAREEEEEEYTVHDDKQLNHIYHFSSCWPLLSLLLTNDSRRLASSTQKCIIL